MTIHLRLKLGSFFKLNKKIYNDYSISKIKFTKKDIGYKFCYLELIDYFDTRCNILKQCLVVIYGNKINNKNYNEMSKKKYFFEYLQL
jgi:hypothetical protein